MRSLMNICHGYMSLYTFRNLFAKVVNLQSVSHMKLSHLFEIAKGEISIRAGKTQGIYKYYLSVDPE